MSLMKPLHIPTRPSYSFFPRVTMLLGRRRRKGMKSTALATGPVVFLSIKIEMPDSAEEQTYHVHELAGEHQPVGHKRIVYGFYASSEGDSKDVVE